jgi:hypothetical protein
MSASTDHHDQQIDLGSQCSWARSCKYYIWRQIDRSSPILPPQTAWCQIILGSLSGNRNTWDSRQTRWSHIKTTLVMNGLFVWSLLCWVVELKHKSF